MNKIVSLTTAQYRFLGRVVRGEKLPTSRYRLQHVTVLSLCVRGCIHARDGHWLPTDFGRKISHARGIWRPGTTVWDSASNDERAAARRLAAHPAYASDNDQKSMTKLQARMRAAGERS